MKKPQSRPLRVLVVDDEEPARKGLIEFLRKDDGISDIIEAADGIAAIKLIQTEKPDLVFLDVQMPEITGFGVIAALGPEEMPLTIFVTAYDQYALQAFDADAIDYLLKPVEDTRLERALARARVRLDGAQKSPLGPNVMQLATERGQTGRHLNRLVVRTRGLTQLVEVAKIDWIGAAGAYVSLHVQGNEFLCNEHLRDLVNKLDPTQFFRIHRSTIINISSVVQLEPISHGEFDVVMKDGARLCLSRTYRSEFEKQLGHEL